MKRRAKRKLMYCQKPATYEIHCDKCNGTNIEWSEFDHCIWCYDCNIDTEGTKGIFDGPIPIHAAYILGMRFDQIVIKTGKVKIFDIDTGKWKRAVKYVG